MMKSVCGTGGWFCPVAAPPRTFGRNRRHHSEPRSSKCPQLFYESKLYAILAGGRGVPRLHWFGQDERYNIMVCDLLGDSLEDLLCQFNRKFSLKTVLLLADQMIARLEYCVLGSIFARGRADTGTQVHARETFYPPGYQVRALWCAFAWCCG